MGRVWGALLATFRDFLSTFSVFLAISRKNLILEGFGGALGGSGEGFGKVLGGSASLSGAAGSSHGCFVLFFVIFCVFSVVSCFLLFSAFRLARGPRRKTQYVLQESRALLFLA